MPLRSLYLCIQDALIRTDVWTPDLRWDLLSFARRELLSRGITFGGRLATMTLPELLAAFDDLAVAA